jgi:hypothetical protein
MTYVAVSETALVSLDVRVEGSDQHGRVFLSLDVLRQTKEAELVVLLNNASFVEEDDAERLALLEQALQQPTVTVETSPGGAVPHELHAYILSPEVSEAPIFACVLAPLELVHLLVKEPPHVVVETASLQIVDSVTGASIIASIESWMRRVWPAARIPVVRLRVSTARPLVTREGGADG